jgi:hypothetical protein
MRRREFIAGLGSTAAWPRHSSQGMAAWPVMFVIMAKHLDRDAVAAGEPHLLSRNEWTGGDV